MFEKFGEMDYEEFIRTAAAERQEGDLEALITLAVENGLEKEDAEDYMDGIVDTLVTPYMAALAKLEGEAKELGIRGHQLDQKDTILTLLDKNEELCLAVRKKEKTLTECLARILTFSSECAVQVPDAIVKLAEFRMDGRKEKMKGPVYEGGETKADVRRIAKEYYLEA